MISICVIIDLISKQLNKETQMLDDREIKARFIVYEDKAVIFYSDYIGELYDYIIFHGFYDYRIIDTFNNDKLVNARNW